MVLRKVIFAIVVALLCIVGFHKAVADTLSLSHVNAITPKAKEKLQVTCGDMQLQVVTFAQELMTDGAALSAFAMQASGVYNSWAQALTPFEDQKHDWPKKFFDPITVSTKALSGSSDEIFSWSDAYEQELGQFEGALKNCSPETPARQQSLTALTNFEKELSDAQQAAGGFVSDMNSQLGDWNHLWRALEGTSTRVPQGYFQSLVKGADELTEASQLFQENAQLLSDHFKAVFVPSLTRP